MKPEDIKPRIDKSKSQKKRDMDALRKTGEKLTKLSAGHLAKIDNEEIKFAVKTAQKISKGNAKKRQIQFIAKLLARDDTEAISDLLNTLDPSSAKYNQKFHKLEYWRDKLIEDNSEALPDAIRAFPHADRQHLRHLVGKAREERLNGQPGIHFKRLFQFLKTLSEE